MQYKGTKAEGIEHEFKRVLGLLKEEKTHDLFCSNCRSCVTEGVYLRKRNAGVHMYRPNRYDETLSISVGSFYDKPEMSARPSGGPLILLFAIVFVALGCIIFLKIVRSIAWGGLMESMASLAVFSFAAGGGATALSTSALTIANLIGGLFFLVNNLRKLRGEHSVDAQIQTETGEERKYQQLRGTPKFFLQATVAVISFLVSGSVAPVTYGFSSRDSDGRYYMFAIVATASLVYILLLALGKAHTQKPPRSYIGTILYYLAMGSISSVISFFVGEGANKLLAQSL